MIPRKIYAFFLFSFFISFHASADYAAESYIVKGDSLFDAGKYTEAFEIYRTVLETTLTYTPQMLLKMAYVKEGLEEYTDALYYLNLYYYHQADQNVLQKMTALAESKNLTGYELNDYEYFLTIYHRYYTLIASVLIAILISLFAMIIYYKRKGQSVLYFAVGYSLFLMFSFYFLNYAGGNKRGIINQKNVLLMNGPSAGATVVSQVEAGHRVKVLDKTDIWYKVEWNGEEVYLREKNISLIQ